MSPVPAWIVPYSAVASAWRESWAFLPERLRSRWAASSRSKPVAIDPDAVLGRELDGQVDRETERVVQAERDVAGQDRDVLGQRLRAPSDDPLLVRDLGEGLVEEARAGVEGPPELGLLALDGRHDLRAALLEVGVGLDHDRDDDLGQLRQERLVATEEATVADGSARDPAQDVAGPSFDGRTPSAMRNVTAREWSAMTW